MERHELGDEQWALIEDLFPKNGKKAGRPWSEHRRILNGMFWILGTGAPWRDLPRRYGPWQTVHRRFSRYRRDGTFDRILERRFLAGRIEGIETNGGRYYADVVVNAAGGNAGEVGRMAGIEIPVVPDSHEGGISAPMERFFDPLIVDIRPGAEGRTANFYFGQNDRGQVIFCYTPIAPIVGTNRAVTSEFMPVISRRLIELIPRLRSMLIRRVWRGLYPMTPDGIIILDGVREVEGHYLAAGMCGQGFMLGPGVGLNMAKLIVHGRPDIDPEVFQLLHNMPVLASEARDGSHGETHPGCHLGAVVERSAIHDP